MVHTEGSTSNTYYFRRNLQGDVTAIYNTSGVKVAEYAYDAWGNCTIVHNTAAIAVRNPIRYRGYYFDSDTGLYYLNARYYSPKWRRFISPDSTDYLDPESVNGLNLYCYCNNDPVNYVDPSGHALVSLLVAMGIGFGIGAFVGAGFEVAKQINFVGWDISLWDWVRIGRSALAGGVSGAISSIPIPGSGFLSYMGTFAFGGVASVAGGIISGSVNSIESGVLAFGLGGAANVIGRAATDFIQYIKAAKEIKAISADAMSIANMNAKHNSLAIWEMIGMNKFSRNAYKSWGYDEIFELLMMEATNLLRLSSTKNLTRYLVYSSMTSSLISGWY